ncbi:crotonase/enoyl-CoA hydratase family protein [Janibacter sp. G1551]|uniref:crotonase/enoyl-CoA hydratase family protein n=1 Tax=Janibacter sp. G1551 TaxID=3420440 RepID=UPI003D05CC3F
MTSNISTTVDAGVAHVRLDRPDKLNALTLPMLRDLADTGRRLSADRSLRAVILSGEGDSFCAGLDFATVLKNPSSLVLGFVPDPRRGTNVFQESCWIWRRMPVPVVAAVDGHCLGGGLQIAMGADFRYTTPDARWSVLEAKWGLIPDMSGIRSLTEQVGLDLAKRLTMTGEIFDGTTAHAYGLASGVADDPHLAAAELVDTLLTRSPDALAASKRLFRAAPGASARAVFARERVEQLRLLFGRNAKAAREAALSKGAQPPAYHERSGVIPR